MNCVGHSSKSSALKWQYLLRCLHYYQVPKSEDAIATPKSLDRMVNGGGPHRCWTDSPCGHRCDRTQNSAAIGQRRMMLPSHDMNGGTSSSRALVPPKVKSERSFLCLAVVMQFWTQIIRDLDRIDVVVVRHLHNYETRFHMLCEVEHAL